MLSFIHNTVSFGIKFSPLATETVYYFYKNEFVEGVVFSVLLEKPVCGLFVGRGPELADPVNDGAARNQNRIWMKKCRRTENKLNYEVVPSLFSKKVKTIEKARQYKIFQGKAHK